MPRLGLDIDDLDFGVDVSEEENEEEKGKSTKKGLDDFEEDDDDVDIEPVINTKERYIEDQSPPQSKAKGNNNEVETEEYGEEEEEETEDEAIKKTAKLSVIIGVVVLIVCLVVLVPLSRKMKNRDKDSAKSTTTNSITSNVGTGATSDTNQDTDTDTGAGTGTQSGNSSRSSSYTSLLDDNSSAGAYANTGTDSGWTKLDSLINCKTEKYGKLKITSISYYAKIIGESVQIKGVAQGKLDGTTGLFEVQIPNNKLNTVSVGKTISVKYKQGIQGSTPVICDIELI